MRPSESEQLVSTTFTMPFLCGVTVTSLSIGTDSSVLSSLLMKSKDLLPTPNVCHNNERKAYNLGLGVVPSSTVYFFTALFCFLIYAEYFKLLFVVSVVLYLYAPFLKRKTAVPLKLPAPVKVFDKVVPEATEPRKWKLSTERGRQVWSFNEKQTPDQQKIYDKYFLGLDTVSKNTQRTYTFLIWHTLLILL